ncbi:MAG: hypothetical protein AAF152_02975 [Cyanobacteria bacterium P01_A01_bin.114]
MPVYVASSATQTAPGAAAERCTVSTQTSKLPEAAQEVSRTDATDGGNSDGGGGGGDGGGSDDGRGVVSEDGGNQCHCWGLALVGRLNRKVSDL